MTPNSLQEICTSSNNLLRFPGLDADGYELSKPAKERDRSSLPDRGTPSYEENEWDDDDRDEGNNEEDDTLDDYKTNDSEVGRPVKVLVFGG